MFQTEASCRGLSNVGDMELRLTPVNRIRNKERRKKLKRQEMEKEEKERKRKGSRGRYKMEPLVQCGQIE